MIIVRLGFEANLLSVSDHGSQSSSQVMLFQEADSSFTNVPSTLF